MFLITKCVGGRGPVSSLAEMFFSDIASDDVLLLLNPLTKSPLSDDGHLILKSELFFFLREKSELFWW